MTKILQITILAAALLLVGYLGFSAFSNQEEDDIVKFLDSVDVVKKFREEQGQKDAGNVPRISPLVKEAEAFALYLNPPPPKQEPRPPVPRGDNRATTPRPTPPRDLIPVRASVNYEVLGTAVNAGRPEESRAIIDLPGTGLQVVRPGQEINHTVIQEIKDGSLVIKVGGKIEELIAKRDPVPSLIKDSPNHLFILQPHLKKADSGLSLENLATSSRLTPSSRGTAETVQTSRTSATTRRPAIPTSRGPGSSRSSRYVPPVQNPSSRQMPPKLSPEEEAKAMEELLGEISKMKKPDGTDNSEMEKMMESVRQMQTGISQRPNNPGTKGGAAKNPE